jgi:hypothetical protein
MSRKNYTAGERAIAVVGVLSGKSLADINAQLTTDQEHITGTKRLLNPRSYKLLKDAYAPHLAGPLGNHPIWQELWLHATAPKPMGEL